MSLKATRPKDPRWKSVISTTGDVRRVTDLTLVEQDVPGCSGIL